MHRDLHAPNRIFSHNTATKSHDRRQPCRGFFSCLAEKSLALECFAVLKERFFLTGVPGGRRNTWCISNPRGLLWGKRFLQKRANPCVRAPRGRPFLTLAAAAVALAAAVIAAAIADGIAVAAAAEQQDQDDDPPAVVAAKTVTTHKNTSEI